MKTDKLKKAIRWISEKRKDDPHAYTKPYELVQLADKASFQFDLSPKDSEFLLRFVKNDNNKNPS